MEPEFHQAIVSSQDFETRGVAGKPNEICYHICGRMRVIDGHSVLRVLISSSYTIFCTLLFRTERIIYSNLGMIVILELMFPSNYPKFRIIKNTSIFTLCYTIIF